MAGNYTARVRLDASEQVKLREMVESDVTGTEGVGDFFRLLLHREYNRRHNLPKPKGSDWQGAFRIGRPKKG